MESVCENFHECGHPYCTLVWQQLCDHNEAEFQSFLLCLQYSKIFLLKEAKRNFILSSYMWMQKLWNGNENRFRKQMRMSKHTMCGLLGYLQEHCGLSAYGRLELYESVGMFMKFVGAGSTYTEVEERFQHSGETVFRHYYHVLQPMCILADQMIQPTSNQFEDVYPVPEKIRGDSRYYPFFDGCVGAMDGTHVVLRIPPTAKNYRYVNRKGRYSTNILAICDFNMCFIYANVGKEGSQNDAGVLGEAIREGVRPFPSPPLGKYYLADFGYGLATGILTPYKNSRYHIPEFRQAGVIRNRDENFNYYHSSLRSVIERSFGVLKSRFKILNQMIKFHKDAQIHTVWACLGLHNFICRYASDDFAYFAEHVMREEYVPPFDPADHDPPPPDDDRNTMDRDHMEALHDSICEDLPFRRRRI